ncbi:hypothetical protein [Bradyrhizobium sp. USDA 4522]
MGEEIPYSKPLIAALRAEFDDTGEPYRTDKRSMPKSTASPPTILAIAVKYALGPCRPERWR